jgi:cyanophycinase
MSVWNLIEWPAHFLGGLFSRVHSTVARRALVSSAIVFAAVAAPSHGPAKGYLVITGGAPDFKHFMELAGGSKARIVVIPTAAVTSPAGLAMLPPYCAAPGPFAAVHCAVLHTTDRTVADSADFVAPLKDATGVWLEGGRHWRLADAYLGTRTLKELFNLLDRGGVIGGGSAGATIQGSYMVRGSSNPDDNTIMMAPGHEIGFGFFTNVTIDQHVDARGRAEDLAPVMKAHPELLGLGLDQSTSITVHGDIMTVNGPQRVAVWDGKDHGGKGYYYLRTGDTLNTATRVATVVEHPPETVRKEVTLPKETLAQYTGMYEMAPHVYMTIALEGEQLTTQLTGQGKLPLFAEADGKFFLKVVDAQLEFVKDGNGKMASLILHQNGDKPGKRLEDAEAKRLADEAAARAALAAQRYKDQKPQPGAEAALRRNIEELRLGEPKYDRMSAGLADVTRRQLPQLKARVAAMGALQAVSFKGVGPGGMDIYDVKFENGSSEWRIILAPDGKIDGVGVRWQ